MQCFCFEYGFLPLALKNSRKRDLINCSDLWRLFVAKKQGARTTIQNSKCISYELKMKAVIEYFVLLLSAPLLFGVYLMINEIIGRQTRCYLFASLKKILAEAGESAELNGWENE